MGVSCDPVEGPNPDTTQSFSAKINGKVWRPSSSDFKAPAISCQIKVSFDEMSISASSSSESLFIIVSTDGKKIIPAKYPLNSDRYLVGVFSKSGPIDFRTGNGYGGEIEIKSIDTLKMRISGTFYYTCFNSLLNESVKVSNGKFDIFYIQYGS